LLRDKAVSRRDEAAHRKAHTRVVTWAALARNAASDDSSARR
jgi:hypothetical protein